MDRRHFIGAAGASAIVFPLLTGNAGAAPWWGRRIESDAIHVSSPGGGLVAEVFTDSGGRLSYRLSRRGVVIVDDSPLGVVVDGSDLGDGVEISSSWEEYIFNEQWPMRGAHSVGLDRCRGAVIPLVHRDSGMSWLIDVRAYDDGMAWRYALQSDTPVKVSGEASSFSLPFGSVAYYQTNGRNYEALIQNSDVDEMSGVVGMPVTVKLPGRGGYLAITEAALYNYSGMMLDAGQAPTLRAVFPDDGSWMVEPTDRGFVISPWRVVMAAADLNGLVNCDMVHNLSPPPDPDLFGDADDWVRPGRALWSWWSEGTGTLALQKRYADAASELGFEYILVDEGWEFWLGFGKTKWDMIAELVDYAGGRDVDVWVWKRWKKLGRADYREKFFRKVRDAGVVGVKIDFMDSESRDMIGFYEDALKDAARRRLMVNFHGANKPAGESRTYPNEMTREGIRGLEYNRFGAPLPPEYNAVLPFTRLLAGHADYTPVTFNPKKMGDTTFAHQLATPICFLSPVTHWADKPENFLDNPDVAPALDVIKKIPTVWDQTIVLPQSELGEIAALARRSGHDWFIGIVNGPDPKTIEIDLGFLDHRPHRAVALADAGRGEAGFDRKEGVVGRHTRMVADMSGGGGYVAILTPR